MRVLQTLQKIDSRSVSGRSAQRVIRACRRQSGGASETAPDFAPDAFLDFLQVLAETGVTDVPSSPLFGTHGDTAYACNILQLIAKGCNSKDFTAFLFWTLSGRFCSILPLAAVKLAVKPVLPHPSGSKNAAAHTDITSCVLTGSVWSIDWTTFLPAATAKSSSVTIR